MRSRPRVSSTMSTVSPSTTFKTSAVVAIASDRASGGELIRHAVVAAATPQTTSARISMAQPCGLGLTIGVSHRNGMTGLTTALSCAEDDHTHMASSWIPTTPRTSSPRIVDLVDPRLIPYDYAHRTKGEDRREERWSR